MQTPAGSPTPLRNWKEIGRRLALASDLTQVTPNQLAFRTCAGLGWVTSLLEGKGIATDEELAKFGRVLHCTLKWILGFVPEQVDDYRADRETNPRTRERLRTILAMRRTTPEDDPLMLRTKKPPYFPGRSGPNLTA